MNYDAVNNLSGKSITTKWMETLETSELVTVMVSSEKTVK